MASIKKKINELTPKETPVLSDSIVISDSENSGKGALVEIRTCKRLLVVVVGVVRLTQLLVKPET